MLCQFTFKNFKSYRDETVFDMQATNVPEFSDSLIPSPGPRFSPLLPVSVIYGPNAGGKSGILEALTYLISKVVQPLWSTSRKRNPLLMTLSEYDPFLFDDHSSDLPTEFELYFRTTNAEYCYTLVQHREQIFSESLYRAKLSEKRRCPILLFTRDKNGIDLGPSLRSRKINSDNTGINPDLPYLSFLAINYHLPFIEEAISWFDSCLSINYAQKGRDLSVAVFPDGKIKDLFLTLLHSMDIPITDYREEILDADEGKYRKIYTTHQVNGHPYQLSLNDESQGTIKILSFLPSVVVSLAQGSLLIVDELDAKIHPKLLRHLVTLYTNRTCNPKGAQLIFTSHDLSTMKSDLLRRDEIWFAAKTEDSASELWSLYELRDETGARVKSTAAYDKQYLEGRYGADPYLRQMLDWTVPDES